MKLITLTRGRFGMVDDSVFALVNQWKWYSLKNGFIVRTDYTNCKFINGKQIGKKTIWLHRLIISLFTNKLYDNLEGDFIDRNPLNCQIENLRVATHANNQTYGKPKSKSKLRGVFFTTRKRTQDSRWVAQLTVNNKRISREFKEKNDAVNYYEEQAKKYHKEFAYLNKV